MKKHENRIPLPVRLKEDLRKRIEDGYYPPGCKIDSVRKLSAEFKVSNITMQKALRMLESDGMVVSIQSSGIFVNEQFRKDARSARIAFVFPEIAISREIMDMETWALDSEIYRGLLAGGQEYHTQVDFVSAGKEMDPLQFQRMLKQLGKYNALVFAGKQLAELQKTLAQKCLVYEISNEKPPEETIHQITYDIPDSLESLARHAAECGCRTSGVFTCCRTLSGEVPYEVDLFYRKRRKLFQDACARFGLRNTFEHELCVSSGNSQNFPIDFPEESLPDFIFWNHTLSVGAFYEYCQNRNLSVGRDVKVAAIATGITFQGMRPSLTYMRVPMFELAKNIVRKVCVPDEVPDESIKAELIIGESTMNHTEKKE